MCLTCYDKLNKYFDFFEECARSQISLMTIFGEDEKKNKVEENHETQLNDNAIEFADDVSKK